MVKKIAVRVLLVLWPGLFSCTTREGNIVSFNAGTGALVVNAGAGNARIFVNYRDTGKKNAGRHSGSCRGRSRYSSLPGRV